MEGGSRDNQLQEIQTLEVETSEWIDGVLDELTWTKDHILSDERIVCPSNPRHLIHKNSNDKHCEICPKLSEGYSKEELEKDQSSEFFYEKSTLVESVRLDDDKFRAILDMSSTEGHSKPIPRTVERYMQELSSAERLRIYEFCIQAAKAKNKHVSVPEEELMLLEDTQKERNSAAKSYLERLAEQRDFKRRRQSYRAKNVHITKKSHKEIIREVILNQMELLGEMWEDEDDKKKKRIKVEKEDVERVEENGEKDVKLEKSSSKKSRRKESSKSRRSRSRDRRYRSRSRERRHRSRSKERSIERPRDKRSRSRERRSRSRDKRSRSRDKRSRSKDRRSRSRDRSRRSRSRGRKSKSHRRSRSRDKKKKAVNLWSMPIKKERISDDEKEEGEIN